MARFDPIPHDASPRTIAASLLRDAVPGPRRSWEARDTAANMAASLLVDGLVARATAYAEARELLLAIENRAIEKARQHRTTALRRLTAVAS